MSEDVYSRPDTATPDEVAAALFTTTAGLAQLRYRGLGPKFVKVGGRVLYRWRDVNAYLDNNTRQHTANSQEAAK